MVNDKTDELLRSAGRGEVEKVQAILDAGTDVNSSNDLGYTALMSAACSYRKSVLSYLLLRGADPRMVCTDGLTALHVAVGSTPSQPEAQAECVRLLVEAGADIEARTDTGLTPLMNASWFGCIGSVEILLNAGVSLIQRDMEGRTAEDLARAKNHDAVVQLLVSKKHADDKY